VTRRSPQRYNDIAGTNRDRLAGIADGIFAVAMTLLVLGLVVPEIRAPADDAGLARALARLGPNLLVYGMSFMTLGIFWLGQATQLSQLARTNRHYTWIQLAFLLSVTFVPFSTGLLARYYELRLALAIYWVNIVLLGATLLAALEYALRAGLVPDADAAGVARLLRGRILIAQLLYSVATALCLVLPTLVSIVLIVLVQLNYVLAPRIPILDRF
jgi:uncharacterized membrane protein